MWGNCCQDLYAALYMVFHSRVYDANPSGCRKDVLERMIITFPRTKWKVGMF